MVFRSNRDNEENEFEAIEVPPELAKDLLKSLARIVRAKKDGEFERIEEKVRQHYGDGLRTIFALQSTDQSCADPNCPLHDGIIVTTHAAGPDASKQQQRTERQIGIVMVDEHNPDPATTYFFSNREIVDLIQGLQTAVNESMQRNRGLKL